MCALFAICDSNYENFSRGGGLIDSAQTADDLTRLPEIGRLDAASRDDPSELAAACARREPKEYAND